MKFLALLTGLSLIAPAAFPQTVIPDPGFGNNGVVITPESGRSGIIYSLAIQNDGRILGAGENYDDSINSHTSLARYLTDGTPDNSFGVNGRVNIPVGWHDALNSVHVQTDGKIVASGNEMIVTVDSSGPVPSATLTSKPFMIRYQPNGAPDSSFGASGVHHLDILDAYPGKSASSMVLLPNGRLIVGGTVSLSSTTQMFLVCLRPDGSYETTFGINGLALYTIEPGKPAALFGMCAQPDGKLILSGYSGTATLTSPPNTRMALARVDTDGLPDAGFANNGVLALQVAAGNPNPFDVANRVMVDQNGKIFAAGGSSNRLAIVCLSPNGSPDLSFGLGGIVYDTTHTSADDLHVLSDGRLLIAGLKANTNPYTTDIILSRFAANGAIDSSFGTSGDVLIDQSAKDRAYAMTVQADDKLLLAGHAIDDSSGKVSFALWRFGNTNTGIEQAAIASAGIFPNPATGMLTVDLQQAPDAPVTLKLSDITGKIVANTVTRSQTTTLSLNGLASGIYVLQLSSSAEVQTYRIIKN